MQSGLLINSKPLLLIYGQINNYFTFFKNIT